MTNKRTWAEISLDNIAYNYDTVKKAADGAAVLAVVKANAYGHGAKQVARMLERRGADWFGTACLSEAVELRRAGITKPILVLGCTDPDSARELSDYGLTQTLLDADYARALSEKATESGCRVNCHIKFDTGMSRIGFDCRDAVKAADAAQAAAQLPGLSIDGAFTHFCVSDGASEEDREFTLMQGKRFADAIEELKRRGINFRWKHCCSSAAIFLYPQFHFDMVRPGIILYGPTPTGLPMQGVSTRPGMQLKTVVTQLKTIKTGETVGYGRLFTATGDTEIATVAVGYADGYSRSMWDRGMMWVNGELAQVTGRICMDQTMLDVTGLSVRVGDEVTVFGGDSPISVDNVAGLSGTVSYEWLCAVSRRVPRVYFEDGRETETVDYLG